MRQGETVTPVVARPFGSERMLVSVCAFLLLSLLPTVGLSQTPSKFEHSYTIISVTPEEIVLDLTPGYTFTKVTDAGDGAALTAVHAAQSGYGLGDRVGAPGIPVVTLSLLAPSAAAATVEFTNVERISMPATLLAPIPTLVNRDHESVPIYRRDGPTYQSARPQPITATFTVRAGSMFRGANTQFVDLRLGSYDPESGLLELIKHAEVHIKFSHSMTVTSSPVSNDEREMFEAGFVNGSVAAYYRSAEPAIRAGVARFEARHNLRANGVTVQGGAEQWLLVETNAEGVYHITKQDLTNAGITGSIDTSTVQLFGTGGAMLDENVTSATGELRECAIEVKADGSGALQDVRFFAPGMNTWQYQYSGLSHTSPGKLDGLFHTLNPYNATGHYLLKVGGSSGGRRVVTIPDTIAAVAPVSSVLVATVHEDEKRFEHPNSSREFLGDLLPTDGSSVNYSISAPGYTPSDWAFLRVGFDSHAANAHTVGVSLNGSHLGDIPGQVYNPDFSTTVDPYTGRSWGTGFGVTPEMGTPNQVSLWMNATGPDSYAWVNWVELFYHRSTDLNSGQISYMLVDTTGAVTYQFSNAAQGEVWDVTRDDQAAVLSGADNSGAMKVTVNGSDGRLSRFVAFSANTMLTPHLSATAVPSLRSTVGQTGAVDVIIAPRELLTQANELKDLRTAGGDATEGMKTIVVFTDDIYREFGYGGHDVSAIRDFMAYMFRHTTATNGTVPLYLTLFGTGHADYQNRVTESPNYVPVYESPSTLSRSENIGPQEVLTDDGYFGRLTNTTVPDVGVGRLSVGSPDEAEVVVGKLTHYEHGSATGAWRSIATFASDDREVEQGRLDALASNHIDDTERALAQVQDRVLIKKVYEVNYPTIITSAGYKKPTAQQAVVDAFNSGCVLFSFVGHGNPTVWTHENLLDVPSTINRMVNYDRLAFLTTATCDFSVYDDFNVHSGGVLFLTNPNGGAVSLLGTSRPVYANEPLVPNFFHVLLGGSCDAQYGSAHVGTAIVAGKISSQSSNAISFYIQGDPALRLLVPRQYVVFDSIQGNPASGESPIRIPALTKVKVTGKISNTCDGAAIDQSFSGQATITLYDADVLVSRISTFTNAAPEQDQFTMQGPILYRGTATVTNGRFSATFIVPKDVELSKSHAKLSGLAYSDDRRAALGIDTSITLGAPDSSFARQDTSGPSITGFLGNRYYHQGDTVATHTMLIVDVHDVNGLNTSTASVGHSFEAWVDDSTSGSIDLGGSYVSVQDDYTTGTSTQAVYLPVGPHVLHIRAFDAVDNPSTVDLSFVARDAAPYKLYEVTAFPNPMIDHTTFAFMQPKGEGNPVAVRVSIFSEDGRHLRDIDATSTSTELLIPWDGRDSGGQRLANGIYPFRVLTSDLSSGTEAHYQGRIIVLH